MQTELMLRLIKNNEIVGYLNIKNGKTKYSKVLDSKLFTCSICEYSHKSILHDEAWCSHSKGFLAKPNMKVKEFFNSTVRCPKEIAVDAQWSCSKIIYNSFELGIKVGKSWYFSGDLLKYDGSNEVYILTLSIGCLGSPEHAKLVGNIHENMPQYARSDVESDKSVETGKVTKV